jgi:hypothetical protein
VLATGKGDKLADLAGKTFASSGPGGLPDQLPRLMNCSSERRGNAHKH